MKNRFLSTLLVAVLASRGWTVALAVPPAGTPSMQAVKLPAIQWQPATDRVVSAPNHPEAAYPRAKVLSNGEILLAYHYGDGDGAFGESVALRRSRDGGASWYQTKTLEKPEPGKFWGFSNPDFIELGNGRILLVSAARGVATVPEGADIDDEFRSECEHGGLRLRFSPDFGQTWSQPRMIAAGRGRLWEPSVVRLADGSLEIYYANEALDLAMDDQPGQRIERIRSVDNGRSWSRPTEVARDEDYRNGMPAALALDDGSVACAQEVVGAADSPWITTLRDGQRQEHYLAQSRYGFGSSPFLARAPDGGTLLAYPSGHRKDPPPGDVENLWMYQNIFVQRGDAKAKNFGSASHPWKGLNTRTGSFYPCLLVKPDDTVVAMASFVTLQPNGKTRTVVRWVEGRFTSAVPTN